LKDQAAAKVQDAASTAQEKASELCEQGSVRLREQFDLRSNQAGSQVRTLAEALRRSVGTYLEQKSGDYGDYRRTRQRWPTRSELAGSDGTGYDRRRAGGQYLDEPGASRADVPSALRDDPLARNPYAGTR
jgi:hypothetical protein